MYQNIQITCKNTKVSFSHVTRILEMAIKNCCGSFTTSLRIQTSIVVLIKWLQEERKAGVAKDTCQLSLGLFHQKNYSFTGVPSQ